MRTTDFSRAPRQAHATSMFIGATRYSGLRAIFTLQFTWWRMVRGMKKMPGYVFHKIYWEFPFTLGTIAFFEDQDAMLRFARSKHHRKLMQWITDDAKNGKAGYIRIYNAEPMGYTNGRWRAEGDVMAHIPHFSPVAGEQLGPKVAKEDRAYSPEQLQAMREDALEGEGGAAYEAARAKELERERLAQIRSEHDERRAQLEGEEDRP